MKYYFIVAVAALFSIKLMAAPTIAPSPEQVSPLLNGLAIPEVTLYSADNKAVALRERVQQQPSVLVFYRGGWCPYCNAQLAALRTIEPELTKLGYQIIAITPDSVSSIVNSMNDTGGQN